jgi:hypothetical protein
MEAIGPYLPWIIQGAAGAIGGNIIGALRGSSSLGPLVNTILGAAGGVGAAYGLGAGGFAEQLSALVGGNQNIADGIAGVAGGLLLPLVASFFKRGS